MLLYGLKLTKPLFNFSNRYVLCTYISYLKVLFYLLFVPRAVIINDAHAEVVFCEVPLNNHKVGAIEM